MVGIPASQNIIRVYGKTKSVV